MISLREYYEKDSKTLPGKGISLLPEQLSAFILALPELTTELKKHGITLPRPKYDGEVVGDGDDQGEEEDGDEEAPPLSKKRSNAKKKEVKKNIDATSDEDEDEED
jgi:hypothetical protein